jgi:hypothetical protein
LTLPTAPATRFSRLTATRWLIISLMVASPAVAGPGEPWHESAVVEKTLAETAFKGMSTSHPAVAAAYGAYKVIEIGRKSVDERVVSASEEVAADLLIISTEAAQLRALVDQGRYPATDTEARQLAEHLRQRAASAPGSTSKFVLRALADRRTLYVVSRNLIMDQLSLFGRVGGGVAKLLGVRQATPILRVSMRGVTGKFKRAEWKAIRDIARRSDLIAEKTAKAVVAGILKRLASKEIDRRIDAAVSDFLASNPSKTVSHVPADMLRVRLIEAAPAYVPVIAVAVQAQPIVLRRSEDPVIDAVSVQNQVVNQYEVDQGNTTTPSYHDDWEDRGGNVPDSITLPSSVNFDGSRFF